MIYQIEDEKKKISHRSSDDFSGGLSEEELLKLIEEVETGEMIHAPVHLKNNVLTQIRKERDGNRKRQLFVYRAKVLIAMAAALMVLILMPAGRMEDVGQMFVPKQGNAVSMEQAALERRRHIDDKWEAYREERASGGIRGMIDDIGVRISQFGENLSRDQDRE